MRCDKLDLSGAKVKGALSVTPEKALEEAIDRAGGQTALARALKISKQAVQIWKIAPVKHVLNIEKITGILRTQLRPDIYPRG